MARLLLLLLACTLSLPAQAFYRTEFSLLVDREHIRDAQPVVVAQSGRLQVRYDLTGTCFVLGRTQDIPCYVWHDSFQGHLIALRHESLRMLFDHELTWSGPGNAGQLTSSLEARHHLNIPIGMNPADPVSPARVEPLIVKTRDGKASFRIY